MSDKKISQLTAATAPLSGTEVLPIVQSSSTVKATVNQVRLTPSPLEGTTATFTGNVGVGATPSAWVAYKAVDLGSFAIMSQAVGTDGYILQGAYFGAASNFRYTFTGTAPARYQLVAGVHSWFSAPSGTAGNVVTFTKNMELGGGNLTLNTGNLVIGAAGKGLDFGSSVLWRTGAGSPEGVVTAAVGSLYTRTDGGLLTTLYVKESGAGNTGWVGK